MPEKVRELIELLLWKNLFEAIGQGDWLATLYYFALDVLFFLLVIDVLDSIRAHRKPYLWQGLEWLIKALFGQRARERAYRKAFARYQDVRDVAEGLISLEARERRRGRRLEPAILVRLRREEIERGEFGPRLPEEEVREVSLLGALCSEGNIVITGEPGTGKTTSLYYLGLLLCDKGVRKKLLTDAERRLFERAFDGKLPAFVRLQDWEKGESFVELLRRQIEMVVPGKASTWLLGERENKETGARIDLLEEYLGERGMVLLLDSLDEMLARVGDEEERERRLREIELFVKAHPRCKFILASRVREYPLRPQLDVEFTILELSPRQMRRFLELRLGEEDARKLLGKLKGKRLHDFGRVPLTLSIIASLYEVGRIDVERLNRAGLFREYVEASLEREKREHGRRFDNEEVKEALIELAWGRVGEDEKSWKLYDHARAANLLKQYGERLEFWHEQLREYFVALELKRRFLAGESLEDYYANPTWEESLILLAGELERPADVERFLSGLYADGRDGRRLRLAARCLGESELARESETGKRLWEHIRRMLGSQKAAERRLAFEFLGEIAAFEAFKVIGLLIERRGEEDWVHCLESWALGEIGELALEPLIQRLGDENWMVNVATAEALVKIGELAVEPLIEKIRDEDWRVRWVIAWALGEIGDERALPRLREVAGTDESEWVRGFARLAIERIKEGRG